MSFEGLLPSRRFITIHPDLLRMVDGNYIAAALLHETWWRGRDAGGVEVDEGWVTMTLEEWADALCTTVKRVRMAIADCGELLESSRRRVESQLDRRVSYRIAVEAICPGGHVDLPYRARRSAPEGTSSLYKELVQEQVTPPTPPPADAVGDEVEEGFASFWTKWPRKQDRKAALKAWRRMKPKDRAAALDAVEPWVENYWRGRKDRNPNFIPYGASWLNGRRWEDEIPSGVPGAAQPTQMERILARMQERSRQ